VVKDSSFLELLQIKNLPPPRSLVKVCQKGLGSYKEYLESHKERRITMAERRKKAERRTPEGRESYMISLAMDQAEEQLRNHTAPSQIVTHFLKLATTKAQVELEKIRAESQLANSKAQLVESQKKSEEIAAKALEAFKSYAGILDDDEYEEDDYYNE
jgi:hypothetical protein